MLKTQPKIAEFLTKISCLRHVNTWTILGQSFLLYPLKKSENIFFSDISGSMERQNCPDFCLYQMRNAKFALTTIIIATSTIQNWVQNWFFWWNCLRSFQSLFTYVTRRLRFLFQFHKVLRLKFEFTETTRRTTFRFSNFSTKFFFLHHRTELQTPFLLIEIFLMKVIPNLAEFFLLSLYCFGL